MALSDREQRILDELEQQLAQDDPNLHRRLSPPTQIRARLVRASLAFVLGLALLLTLSFDVRFGVAGAVVMLGALVVGGRAVGDLLEQARTRDQKDPADH